MTDYECVQIPSVVRRAADDLLRQANGDANEALSLAQEIEAQDEGQTDSDYVLAIEVRVLCHYRANAAYEGFTLLEIIEK